MTPSCAGPFALATANGTSAAPGTAGAGLNPGTGQVISSGSSGTYTAPGELIMYPEGFRPMEVLKEDDYQYNVGEKFNVFGWAVDAGVGYGKDIDNIYTWNSGNRSLFIDTHTSPSNFYDGSFSASQFTGTIDATHAYNVGLASPLTVAVGVEAREDTYAIGAGDPASYYKEGAQSFPGFTPSAAGDHSRKNYAGYIDLAVAPDRAPAARRGGPRRALHRFRRHPDRQDHGALRLQPAMGDPRHHLDRLPRPDPGGRILYRRQRLADTRPPCSCLPTPRRPRFWACRI